MNYVPSCYELQNQPSIQEVNLRWQYKVLLMDWNSLRAY